MPGSGRYSCCVHRGCGVHDVLAAHGRKIKRHWVMVADGVQGNNAHHTRTNTTRVDAERRETEKTKFEPRKPEQEQNTL